MKTHNFIERSIIGALTFLKDSIFAEEYALRNGFMQSLDPRVKITSFLLFILQILFIPQQSHPGNGIFAFIYYSYRKLSIPHSGISDSDTTRIEGPQSDSSLLPLLIVSRQQPKQSIIQNSLQQ